jgi:enolase-phosphatase E1
MIKVIITDIEGTTSSLSFVKDILFPYARAHLAEFVYGRIHEPQVQSVLAQTCQVLDEQLDTEQAISQLIAWLDQDKKITPLKSLQGLIWEAGYQQGDLQGHIYTDAAEHLQQWHNQGLALYVYSSGSVHAQKLLFTHTEFGDLTSLFSGYFDTNIGSKKDLSSYQYIVKHIGLPAEQLLFLSDMVDELDAAKSAGFTTIQLVRDTATQLQASHRQVSSFAEIFS